MAHATRSSDMDATHAAKRAREQPMIPADSMTQRRQNTNVHSRSERVEEAGGYMRDQAAQQSQIEAERQPENAHSRARHAARS